MSAIMHNIETAFTLVALPLSNNNLIESIGGDAIAQG